MAKAKFVITIDLPIAGSTSARARNCVCLDIKRSYRIIPIIFQLNIFIFLAESLRARHQEIRVRRIDLEKVREEVIKHLKNIHNRITLRRKEGQ
jgi:hypothetical protein